MTITSIQQSGKKNVKSGKIRLSSEVVNSDSFPKQSDKEILVILIGKQDQQQRLNGLISLDLESKKEKDKNYIFKINWKAIWDDSVSTIDSQIKFESLKDFEKLSKNNGTDLATKCLYHEWVQEKAKR